MPLSCVTYSPLKHEQSSEATPRPSAAASSVIAAHRSGSSCHVRKVRGRAAPGGREGRTWRQAREGKHGVWRGGRLVEVLHRLHRAKLLVGAKVVPPRSRIILIHLGCSDLKG